MQRLSCRRQPFGSSMRQCVRACCLMRLLTRCCALVSSKEAWTLVRYKQITHTTGMLPEFLRLQSNVMQDFLSWWFDLLSWIFAEAAVNMSFAGSSEDLDFSELHYSFSIRATLVGRCRSPLQVGGSSRLAWWAGVMAAVAGTHQASTPELPNSAAG